jgi:hypothetical protein
LGGKTLRSNLIGQLSQPKLPREKKHKFEGPHRDLFIFTQDLLAFGICVVPPAQHKNLCEFLQQSILNRGRYPPLFNFFNRIFFIKPPLLLQVDLFIKLG